MGKSIILNIVVLGMSFLCTTSAFSPTVMPINAEITEDTQPSITITYKSFNVPRIDSSFKTYMDYRTITDVSSPQYNFIKKHGWCDNNGFMRTNGEQDLGVDDDYYMIALGSHYGKEIGTKYRITTDAGNVFYGVLCDQKQDAHTNNTQQYSYNNDVVEFIVDVGKLNPTVKKMGSANVHEPLNGNIIAVEQMLFIENGG